MSPIPALSVTWLSVLWFSAAINIAAADPTMMIHQRSRVAKPEGVWETVEREVPWEPTQTAIIVCDMWDSHHCLNAVRRGVEMTPRMNEVLIKGRSLGVLIIHAPSGCMEPYRDHPGRKLAKAAPRAPNLPPDIGKWCYQIPAEEQGTYPIDQAAGGEDDDLDEHALWHEKLTALGRNPKSPWKAQTAGLSIADQDAISDSGVEIWNLLEARGIKHVILLGVHTNMCVLGRPFGLRQMAKNGKQVVLMRDLTDTMYDPTKRPYVSHYAGTSLIVEHIEKFVCPTITSVDFLGGSPFQFSRDHRRIAILIGDDEYKTEVTLPALVKSDLQSLGFEVTLVHADSHDKNNFPGMAEAIREADLVFVSVRRRLPPKDQLDALRQHIAVGKPVVGIRTACHAWCLRDDTLNQAAVEKGLGVWPTFDPEILGGHYSNHYGNGPPTKLSLAAMVQDHPILRGLVGPDGPSVTRDFVGVGSLYKVNPLTDTTTPILIGSIPNEDPEPVAWTNRAGPKQSRVFNTTLGHPDDFTHPAFRKLLVNALFWALDDPYPKRERIDELLPRAVK